MIKSKQWKDLNIYKKNSGVCVINSVGKSTSLPHFCDKKEQ